MFNRSVSAKTIAFFMLIPAILILLGTIAAGLFIPSFAFSSGVSLISLIPFFFLTLVSLFLSGICIYISIRYFKNKPFKENEGLGKLFVFFGIGYFSYTFLICVISNLTGNAGGFGQPIVAFLIMLILLPLGLGLKNGYS